MVDFSDLMRDAQALLPDKLEETFLTLDRKTTHVDLRPGQIELLRQLDENLGVRDLVMRVSTGGGKTVVALLYLYHLMKRDNAPSVYLVPTTQLVEQVLREAQNIGVLAHAYLRGETYPHEECLRAEAVIVCTYDKMFNGRSTFLRSDVAIVPGAIVLDDVHAGIEEVRGCYSARLPDEAYVELRELLGGSMDKQVPGIWSGVMTGDDVAITDVPFWIWIDHLESIRQILESHREEGDLRFSWKHLSDRLELVRCTISGAGAEVTLDPAPIEQWRPYGAAEHRLFMSASINDGSALIRELACSPNAVAQQLGSSSDRGPGERMILTTSLVDPNIDSAEIAELAASIKDQANVVVLVSSEKEAKIWRGAGAEYVSGSDVADVVDRLRSARAGNYIVLAQRYDGVDLPDDACRILIIDGIPRGEALVDKADQQTHGNVVGTRNRTINRLEQGLGRAVRSPADYCAVLLVGRDLAAFIGQTATQELLSPATTVQLQMSREMSKLAGLGGDHLGAIRATILQSLRRDPAWRRYYAQKIASGGRKAAPDVLKDLAKCAIVERRALAKALGRDFVGAASELAQAIKESDADASSSAVLMERMARYVYQFDQARAHAIQRSAYAKSTGVSRPISTIPARVVTVTAQADKVSGWLRSYTEANAAIAKLETLKSQANFANPARRVEQALKDLGDWLGADSSMPENEFGRGPDVLWRFPNKIFVLEAKTENRTKLHKADAGQLMLSTNWCRETYPDSTDIVSVVVGNTMEADAKIDFAFDPLVLNEAAVLELIKRLQNLATAAVVEGGLFTGTPQVVQTHLNNQKLLPPNIQRLMAPVR